MTDYDYPLDPCCCESCLKAHPERRVEMIRRRDVLLRAFRVVDAPPALAPVAKGPVRTYEETGAILGLHRGTVQKIETKALRKLRRVLQEVAA